VAEIVLDRPGVLPIVCQETRVWRPMIFPGAMNYELLPSMTRAPWRSSIGAPSLRRESAIGLSATDAPVRMVKASVLPEPFKPIRRESRVAYGRGNRPVAKVVLDRPGILPVIGQLVAG
jgi:hypothetical protein